jgi:hypothetical protein
MIGLRIGANHDLETKLRHRLEDPVVPQRPAFHARRQIAALGIEPGKAEAHRHDRDPGRIVEKALADPHPVAQALAARIGKGSSACMHPRAGRLTANCKSGRWTTARRPAAAHAATACAGARRGRPGTLAISRASASARAPLRSSLVGSNCSLLPLRFGVVPGRRPGSGRTPIINHDGLVIFHFATLLIVVAMNTMQSATLPKCLLASTLPMTFVVTVSFLRQVDPIHYTLAAMAIGAQGFLLHSRQPALEERQHDAGIPGRQRSPDRRAGNRQRHVGRGAPAR